MFSCHSYRDHRFLHSFPTRRSSDLEETEPRAPRVAHHDREQGQREQLDRCSQPHLDRRLELAAPLQRDEGQDHRSEEHTSELQSLAYLVCRLLLEKKNWSTLAIRTC